MSASDDNAPEGAPQSPDRSGATPPAADDTPRTLRSPLPPPQQMPGIAPMPELSQAGTPTAPSPAPVPMPAAGPTTPPVSNAAAYPAAANEDDPATTMPSLPPLAPREEGPEVRTPIAGYGQQVERGGWQVRDKVESNDPVQDEELLAVEGGDGWAIAGASRIGRGHLHDGKYREDGLAAAITPGGWHLVAVADGGGSYRLARVGAPLAVRAAVAAMREALEGVTGNPKDADKREVRGEGERFTTEETEGREGPEEEKRGTAEDAEIEARAALVAGLRAARRALEDEAERRHAAGDEALTAYDLRTTLLLALHRTLADGGALVAGAQVGDGLIAARAGATGALYVLGEAETGPVGNETMFLPDVPDEDGEWFGRVHLAWLDDAGADVHLLALTDGVSDDFAPAGEHLWRLERPLFASALASGRAPAAAAEALRDLLDYERAGSFDDRTLVCVYRGSAVP